MNNGVMDAAEFGLRAGGHDSRKAFNAMTAYCRANPGTTMRIQPGTYRLRDEEAVDLMNCVLSGQFGVNPEPVMFRPYYPYARGLDFRGAVGLTLLAEGVELLCDGWMEPVSIDGCRDVRIVGLTIDYLRKPYSVGSVVAVGEGFFDVHFEDDYPVVANTAMTRISFWDYRARRTPGRYVEGGTASELIAPNTLRIKATCPVGVGCQAMVAHTYHFRPAILILESESIHLDNVTIHSQPGMGIVAHRSKDLFFHGLRIVPRPGQHISTNTDATHMTSCTGLIEMVGCQIEGAGDDAANIHSYYYTVDQAIGPCEYDISVRAPTFTHAQVLDYPDVGDTLELVERDCLRKIDVFRVEAVENDVPGWRSRIRLDRPLPVDCSPYFLADVTRLPAVRIINCVMRQHRGRSLLMKTRRVHIEGCTFEGSTGTPVFVGAEGWWHEGVTSEDVVVRYNRMIECNADDTSEHGSCGVVIGIGADRLDVPDLYKRILIEGNHIISAGTAHGILVNGGQDVTVRYNRISGCREPIQLLHCTDIQLHDNGG